MVETPEDIKAAARAVLQFDVMETVEIKGVPILLLNIERAILAERLSRATTPTASEPGRKFQKGDRVRKTKGSSWQGFVVGFYNTELTPVGYCVESEREPGSVQIYPEAALEFAPESTASELVEEYYSDDPAKLKRLLAQRDKFIVDQGWWSLFVGALSNVGED